MRAETIDTTTTGARTTGLEFSTPYKVYIVVVLLLTYVSNYADRMILGVLTPLIKAEFGASDTVMGLLAGPMFAIFYATLGLPIAILADRWSRKHIILLAMTIWSGMTALCGVASTFPQLALARIGVGIGEAGGSPPAHSIIADLFSPKARSTALAIYSLGVPFGLLVGLYGGARIAEEHGWRGAFLALGLPGVFLALLVMFTLREPRRGASEGRVALGKPPSLWQTTKFMASQRSLVHAIAGATIATFCGYAGVQWWPSFMMRSHGLSLSDMSLFLSLVFGAAGGLGVFLGGALADRLARKDIRWTPRVVAAAIVLGFPFSVGVYLVDSSWMVYVLISVPAFMSALYLAPTFSMVQSLVGVRMRAVAAAILLFVVNLIGMGLGPLTAGFLSDVLTPVSGDSALAHSLLLVSTLSLWGAAHYWRAGRSLGADLERAAKV
jgi:predicted MFS family arabinose efflux permease